MSCCIINFRLIIESLDFFLYMITQNFFLSNEKIRINRTRLDYVKRKSYTLLYTSVHQRDYFV